MIISTWPEAACLKETLETWIPPSWCSSTWRVRLCPGWEPQPQTSSPVEKQYSTCWWSSFEEPNRTKDETLEVIESDSLFSVTTPWAPVHEYHKHVGDKVLWGSQTCPPPSKAAKQTLKIFKKTWHKIWKILHSSVGHLPYSRLDSTSSQIETMPS